jgi:hypothetical protein
MNRWLPLIEQLAATVAAYYAVQLVRRLHIENQVRTAMRQLERDVRA